eukprot:m.110015 g.110015  ORF g.110015 m.110015 type:complete len:405 (-) comp14019_c0_seq3:85-1299(-)
MCNNGDSGGLLRRRRQDYGVARFTVLYLIDAILPTFLLLRKNSHVRTEEISDELASGCMICNKKFNKGRWRHHCRCCGWVICEQCSHYIKKIEVDGRSAYARTCRYCKKDENIAHIKSFKESNYKKFYKDAKPPKTQEELYDLLQNVVVAYGCDHDCSENDVKDYLSKLKSKSFDDFKQEKLADDVIHRVWSSDVVLKCGNGSLVELCSILNYFMRLDQEKNMLSMARIARALTKIIVCRDREYATKETNLKAEDTEVQSITYYRGTRMPTNEIEHYRKCESETQFRASHLMATSEEEEVARFFANRSKPQPQQPQRPPQQQQQSLNPVIWHITVGKGGSNNTNKFERDNKILKQEKEYLFAPYSTFKFVKFVERRNENEPHVIHVEAIDNLVAPEDLPTATWI